jgi:hypothetical protein
MHYRELKGALTIFRNIKLLKNEAVHVEKELTKNEICVLHYIIGGQMMFFVNLIQKKIIVVIE